MEPTKPYNVPPESAPLITKLAAQRLRMRLALKDAERLAGGESPVQVDDAGVAAFLKEIDAAIEGINPAVQRAVAAGELALVRAYNAAKLSVLRDRTDVENRARKFRGEPEVQRDFGATLDEELGPEEAARVRGKGAAARLLYSVTVAAQALGPPRRLIYATVAVVAIGLAVHVFVLDTFGILSPRTATQNVDVAGVRSVQITVDNARVEVTAGFDPKKQVRELSKQVGTGVPVTVESAQGAPVAVIAGDHALVLPDPATDTPAVAIPLSEPEEEPGVPPSGPP